MLERMLRKGYTPPLLVGVQNCTAALETSMAVPQENQSPSRYSNSTLGIYPKHAYSYNKDICSTMFIAALFVIARTWKQPRCPSTEEWMEKMWYFYTMVYYLVEKNNGTLNSTGK